MEGISSKIPPCTKEQVNKCRFSAWYPQFKGLTIRSLVIPLQRDDVDYLLAEGGLVMPEGCNAPEFACQTGSEDDDSDREEWEHDESLDIAKPPKLPGLVQHLEEAIAKLGGVVFPKLNWSAPRDAAWVSYNGTLKCQSPYDIFLLLKSSDFVTHDLTQPYKDCSDCEEVDDAAPSYEIVLRRWRTVIPGMEFRCFVKNHRLIGVCQRDDSAFYDYLKGEHKKQQTEEAYSDFVSQQQEGIGTEIQRFFQEKISGKFMDGDYVVDVYRRTKNKFWLIDFNPFSSVTDPLLFTWEELSSLPSLSSAEDGTGAAAVAVATAAEASPAGPDLDFEFRINRNKGVQPSPFLSNRLPKDIVDLSTGSDIHKFVDFYQMQRLGVGSDGGD